MIGELLTIPGQFWGFVILLGVFGFAPGIVLALIVRLIPDVDRRRELQAELYEVPRWERPFWVAEQFEVALRIGLPFHAEWVWGRYFWHRSKLESGLERHLEHPDSFEIPGADEKAEVRPGDHVKLMWSVERLGGERMWVQVTKRKSEQLVGTLDNWPMFAYMNPDEKVTFHIDDIIDWMPAERQAEATA